MYHLALLDSCSFSYVGRDARGQDEYMKSYFAQCIKTGVRMRVHACACVCVCVCWFEAVLYLAGNLTQR